MQDRLISARLMAGRKSILLLGPRQVGKSTLCKSLGPAFTINLADEQQYLAYSKDPSRLRREIQALTRSGSVLVDEVQRVPALLNTIQSLIDDSPEPRRFLLTGSSARKLRRGGANLLPGRVILENLDPLAYGEVKEGFDLERALRVGMLPGVYLGDAEAEEVLGTYAEVYLREEIRAEAIAKDIGGYARFLDSVALASGQWLNYSKLSSDVEIPKETIRRFVSVLEDTLLAFRLPSFQPRRKLNRRLLQRDKLFLFDVGVRNALLGLHRRGITLDQRGALFEHWMVLQVIYLNRALRKGWNLSSYRTDGGAEVDLVLERGDEVIGIEIKASRNVGRTDTRGLESLAETVGKSAKVQKWIAFLGESPQLFESGVQVFPYLEVLEKLADSPPS